jgi:CubicO group peptidase (beta-lactamase class C family)
MMTPGILVVGLMQVLATSSPAQTAPPMTGRDLEAFSDGVFKRYLDDSAAPSLAIIIVRGDSVLFQKGYGLEHTDPSRPVDPDSTLFHVASISKLFVATAALQLSAAGRLRLDDPLTRLLSGVIPAGGLEGVTLRHLLSHTSGLDAPFMRSVVAEPGAVFSLRQYFTRYPPRLGRAPGREIRYSNDGMSLAALAVENAAGQRFDRYVEEHIFGPLKMERSTFRQPPPQPLADRVATAGSGPVPDALVLYPSGSMVSTAADMGRFLRAHLTDGTLDPMHRRQWSGHPRAPGVALGFFESDIGGPAALFHTGARVHFSLLYLIPERRLGIFVVHSMRQGGPFQSLRTDYVREFTRRYLPASENPAPLRPGAAGRATRLAGTYRPVLLSATTIERAAWLGMDTGVTPNGDGSLTVAIPAGPKLRVWEAEPARYVTREDNAGLTIAFSDTLGTEATRMFLSGGTQDPVGFDRLAWYERGLLHAAILAAAVAVIMSFAPIAALRGLVRRIRRAGRAEVGPGERRAERIAVWSSGLMLTAPLVGVALAMFGQSESGAPGGLRVALGASLSLVLAGAVLALATMPAAVLAWRHGYWTLGRRLYFTSFGFAAALLLPLLAYYHLLVFWL